MLLDADRTRDALSFVGVDDIINTRDKLNTGKDRRTICHTLQRTTVH
jgi:hypothetical protein